MFNKNDILACNLAFETLNSFIAFIVDAKSSSRVWGNIYTIQSLRKRFQYFIIFLEPNFMMKNVYFMVLGKYYTWKLCVFLKCILIIVHCWTSKEKFILSIFQSCCTIIHVFLTEVLYFFFFKILKIIINTYLFTIKFHFKSFN